MLKIDPFALQIKDDLDRRFAAAWQRYEKAKARWHANRCRTAPPRLTWRPQPRPRVLPLERFSIAQPLPEPAAVHGDRWRRGRVRPLMAMAVATALR
jgi:hypothetical protein